MALGSGKAYTIGSGGLRSGLDLARAIAMGADAGGFARTILDGADNSYEVLETNIRTIIRELKTAMLLTGSEDVSHLKSRNIIIQGALSAWMEQYVRKS